MDGNYPKYLLYVVFFLGSWLVTCLLHFRQPSGGSMAVMLLFSSNVNFSTPVAVADDDWQLRPPSSPSCDGRYVHLVNLPPEFHVCTEGSPAFTSEHSICQLMSNAGLGPVLLPFGDRTDDGDTDIVPNTGW
jgi:hypothetical protein